MGRSDLDLEEWYTVICDIEGLIKSRLLTTENINDLVSLTSSVFLQGIADIGLPDLDNLENVNFKRILLYLLKMKIYKADSETST